jgi:hypothetical protein
LWYVARRSRIAARARDPLREPVEKRRKGHPTSALETPVSLLGSEIAQAQDRMMRIPMTDERIDEDARVREPLAPAPRSVDQIDERRHLESSLLGESQRSFGYVLEVLVERRR